MNKKKSLNEQYNEILKEYRKLILAEINILRNANKNKTYFEKAVIDLINSSIKLEKEIRLFPEIKTNLFEGKTKKNMAKMKQNMFRWKENLLRMQEIMQNLRKNSLFKRKQVKPKKPKRIPKKKKPL